VKEIDIRGQLLANINNIEDVYNDFSIYCRKQSEYDCMRAFWLHYIESNTITTKIAYRIIRELKRIARERRVIKNNIEIIHLIQLNENKLSSSELRQELISSLENTMSRQDEYVPYNCDYYTKEDIEEILGKGE